MAEALSWGATGGIAVLIPAWQPDHNLPQLVTSLLELSFPAIIIVNDGSDADRERIFEELQELPPVRIVRHGANLGKGRALKTGMAYFLTHYRDYSGIVTCDADGQHRAADVLATAETLRSARGRLVLGSRRFETSVPFRSRVGNALTKYLFAAVTGKRLADTQSGLRGIPIQIVPWLLRLSGERYEYEMNVLAGAAARCGIVEVPIETIYLAGNRSSHFHPVWDSMRIYVVLARFYLSSLIAAGIDFAVFTLVFWITADVLLGVLAGRVSSLPNFFLNRRFVFTSDGLVRSALCRYYALVLVIAAASYSGIHWFTRTFGMNVPASKVLVETALSLVSFSAQRAFVFPSESKE